MTNDKWQMTNDKWQMTNVKWQMTNDKWQMTNDKWQMTDWMVNNIVLETYEKDTMMKWRCMKAWSLNDQLMEW